jgi:hypothetical protein
MRTSKPNFGGTPLPPGHPEQKPKHDSLTRPTAPSKNRLPLMVSVTPIRDFGDHLRAPFFASRRTPLPHARQ